MKRVQKYSKVSLSALIAFLIVFVPFTVKFEKGFHVEENKACAVTPVADAVGFIEEAAQASALTAGEFVATVAGIIATTGYNIGSSSSISMDNTLSENLAAISPTSEYPAWSTLSSYEQTDWGSEDNYNAARLNNILPTFDLHVDDYYTGGGSHSFSSGELDTLGEIGAIGQDWKDGVGIIASSIFGTVKEPQVINQYFGQLDYSVIDGSNIEDWPSGVPTTVYLYNVSYLGYKAASNNYYWFQPSVYAYVFMTQDGNNFVSDTFSADIAKYAFSTTNEQPAQSKFRNLPSKTKNGLTYYANYGSYSSGSNLQFVNIAPSPGYVSNVNAAQDLAYILLRENMATEPAEVQPNVPDYPGEENIDNDVVIYFPSGGLTDDTNWDDLLSYQEEITDDLSGVISLLRKIDSDLNSGFGKFMFDNQNYLLVKDPAIYSLLNTYLTKFHFNNDNELLVYDPKIYNLINTFKSLFHFNSDNELLVYDSKIYTLLNTMLSRFGFYNNGELKVHDLGVYEELSDIYSLLLEISGKMANWGDIAESPEIIGDFDFDDVADRVPNLIDTIEELAPFGSLLLLTEIYTVLSSIQPIQDPSMTLPFTFGGLDDNQEVVLDLGWLDDIKPVINFFCILMLLLAITRATMKIVELEAAS